MKLPIITTSNKIYLQCIFKDFLEFERHNALDGFSTIVEAV